VVAGVTIVPRHICGSCRLCGHCRWRQWFGCYESFRLHGAIATGITATGRMPGMTGTALAGKPS
jgi:hypothetical protein